MDIVEKNVRARSDGELYAMLHLQRDDWSEDALKIAADEWSRRSLDESKFTEAVSAGHEKVKQDESRKFEPLGTQQRIVFFVLNFWLCLGLPQLLLA